MKNIYRAKKFTHTLTISSQQLTLQCISFQTFWGFIFCVCVCASMYLTKHVPKIKMALQQKFISFYHVKHYLQHKTYSSIPLPNMDKQLFTRSYPMCVAKLDLWPEISPDQMENDCVGLPMSKGLCYEIRPMNPYLIILLPNTVEVKEWMIQNGFPRQPRDNKHFWNHSFKYPMLAFTFYLRYFFV